MNLNYGNPAFRYRASFSFSDFSTGFPILWLADLKVFLDGIPQTLITDYTVVPGWTDSIPPAGGKELAIRHAISLGRRMNFIWGVVWERDFPPFKKERE